MHGIPDAYHSLESPTTPSAPKLQAQDRISYPPLGSVRWLRISIAVAAILALASPLRAADDISSILDSIENRGSSASTQPKSSTEKKSKSSSSSGKSKSGSKRPIWSPRDKLPKDIIGHGVAGNFVLRGEYATGGAVLIPAEDVANPFAREFVVANLTSGLPRGTFIPITQRRLVQVPRSKPLIFVGRGIPGSYIVESR